MLKVRMASSPFAKGPDSFLLQLSGHGDDVVVAPFETDWGATDEKLCFVRGVLIGRVIEESPLLLSLAPAIDPHRPHDWPSPTAFLDAVLMTISQADTWDIRCERDRDQTALQTVASFDALKTVLGAAVTGCSTGVGVIPSFSANSGAVSAHA
jgi:hypothetical protein